MSDQLSVGATSNCFRVKDVEEFKKWAESRQACWLENSDTVWFSATGGWSSLLTEEETGEVTDGDADAARLLARSLLPLLAPGTLLVLSEVNTVPGMLVTSWRIGYRMLAMDSAGNTLFTDDVDFHRLADKRLLTDGNTFYGGMRRIPIIPPS